MVYYRGAKGKAIYFSIDKVFYHSLVSNLAGVGKEISMGGKGYLYNGNHAVTRMVLGLEKGSSQDLDAIMYLDCMKSRTTRKEY